MRGLNTEELNARIKLGEKITDYLLSDFEGEYLFYHRLNDKEAWKLYIKERRVWCFDVIVGSPKRFHRTYQLNGKGE